MADNTNTEKGTISVNTEKLLPIIKKWLYSDKDIFLRELVSNAVDAITKLKQVALTSDGKIKAADPRIDVIIDKKKDTLTISDNGIGMTADEIKKYINQIAFSGAEDFLEKYKSDQEKEQIIGHFGLGFYSAFMVAEKVEILTRSYQPESQAVKWESDGNSEYTLEPAERDAVGTDIILHISKDEKEMLEDSRIREIIKKYCNFLPVPIYLDQTIENDQHPLWIKSPQDCSDDDYKEFYKKLFPMDEEPHFWVHLNVDYPFHLQGILYFPKTKALDIDPKNFKGLKLYCNQVYVTDNTQDLLPEFLTMLRGVVDSPDIPLNVSRSYLQTDQNVRKISNHIIKKVGDVLTDMYKNDRERYESGWEDMSSIIKFGMMNHDKFYDRMKDIVIYRSTNEGYTTINDYLSRNKETNENTVLYTTGTKEQATYIDLLKSHNMEAIVLDAPIDTHYINFLESKETTIKYKRVDSDLSEFFSDSDRPSEIVDPNDNKTPSQKIEEMFKNTIKNDHLTIKVEYLKTDQVMGMVTLDENMRRFKDMMAVMNRTPQEEDLGDHTMVVNANNDVVKKALDQHKSGQTDESKLLCEQIYDLALMQQNALYGERLTTFLSRSGNLLTKV